MYIPVLFKHAVDALAAPTPEQFWGVAAPVALIAGYGLARASSSAFNELRNFVFSKVRGVSVFPLCTSQPCTF